MKIVYDKLSENIDIENNDLTVIGEQIIQMSIQT